MYCAISLFVVLGIFAKSDVDWPCCALERLHCGIIARQTLGVDFQQCVTDTHTRSRSNTTWYNVRNDECRASNGVSFDIAFEAEAHAAFAEAYHHF